MTPSFEANASPLSEAAAEARANVEWRQLLKRFFVALALITLPVGAATLVALWMPPVR